MLRDTEAVANIPVKNMESAKKFYADTLGLPQVDAEGEDVTVFRSGNSRIFVYRSKFAGTNKATAMSWVVDDVEDVVRTLREKGVRFEHYDLPETKREGDIHVAGDMKVAWFKDPDGNILNVINQ